VARARRYKVERPALEREVETPASVAGRAERREADLSLLRALVEHYAEALPPDGDEERWVADEEAFGGMLRRLEEAGEAAVLTRNQREWAKGIALKRELEWEEPAGVQVFLCGGPKLPAEPRYVEHPKFGRGLVVDERDRGSARKLDVDFGGDVGVKTMLASFVTPAP